MNAYDLIEALPEVMSGKSVIPWDDKNEPQVSVPTTCLIS